MARASRSFSLRWIMRLSSGDVKGVEREAPRSYLARMSKELPGLADDHSRAHAWRRFRLILWAMSAVAMACSLLVVAYLWWLDGALPIIFVLLTIAGVWTTIMMAALLMGLMFLSSGTGHDHHVEDRVSQDILEKHGE